MGLGGKLYTKRGPTAIGMAGPSPKTCGLFLVWLSPSSLPPSPCHSDLTGNELRKQGMPLFFSSSLSPKKEMGVSCAYYLFLRVQFQNFCKP